MRRLYTVLVILAFATPAFALVNLKAGYTSTQGELSERYKGGFGGMIELDIGLPGPFAIVPMGGYMQLGEDKEFSDLLDEYIEQYFPPQIPLPPELQNLGKINSSLYYFGVGARLYAVDNPAIRFYGEGGVGYYYRDMDAQGVPLSLIGSFIPEFKEFAIEPAEGVGIHGDFGLELIPISPIAPQIGIRYIHAMGIGKTSVDDFMAENVPGFDPVQSENVDLILFYGGIGIF